MIIKKFKPGLLLMAVIAFYQIFSSSAHALPMAVDSRVRTFVYGENEVFQVGTSYGYQTTIEFAKNETVQTISLGDSVVWQIIPVDNRIFIKPLLEEAHTNMSVITNKRSYQFELSALPSDDIKIIYIARFYYPDRDFELAYATSNSIYEEKRNISNFRPDIASENDETLDFTPNSRKDTSPSKSSLNYNFNYSLEGPDSIAPIKVFDDGRSTFFKFRDNMEIPTVAAIDSNRAEKKLSTERVGDFLRVNGIAREFVLRLGKDKVKVFNDSLSLPQNLVTKKSKRKKG